MFVEGDKVDVVGGDFMMREYVSLNISKSALSTIEWMMGGLACWEEDIEIALFDQKSLTRDHLLVHPCLNDGPVPTFDCIRQRREIADQ